MRSVTPLYDSKWVKLAHADVVLPSGEHNPRHHVVTMPPAAMAVLLNPDHTAVLMSWRHRFVSDVWNWELPGGLVDEGEEPAETIARELIEETGYQAGSIEHLVSFEPMIGMVTSPHHVYLATDAQHVGDPTELNEGRFQWVLLAQIPALVAKGDIRNSGTLVGLLHYLALNGGPESA
ncbi:NUDIX hydrolase [Kribbella monticola]|uniref:NUDIX hydrolase n=1 Tax=Kribbella monticola TaxID=2185285 RepID=UPI0018E55FD2|nr:NUDIX hydrolase [Kribbella monticola]